MEQRKLITRELIQEAIESGADGDNSCKEIERYEVKFSPIPGKHFNSDVFTATVWLKSGEVVNLFLKLQETKEHVIKWQDAVQLYHKEMAAYSEVLPAMVRAQHGSSSQILPPAPKFYLAKLNPRKMVIMQNLLPDGYTMADLGKGMDFKESKLVMKGLAKLHALGLMMTKKGLCDYNEKFGCEGIFCPAFFDNYKVYFNYSLAAEVEIMRGRLREDENAMKRVEKLVELDYAGIVRSACKPTETTNVFCHGDVMAINCMIKYGDDLEKTPLDLKFVDYQCVKYSNPVSDLGMFFYHSTWRSLREAHLEELLKIYFDAFTANCDQLGVGYEEFSFDALRAQFEEKRFAWLLLALTYLPTHLSKPEYVPNYLDPNSDDIPSQVMNSIVKSGFSERVCELVMETLDRGFL